MKTTKLSKLGGGRLPGTTRYIVLKLHVHNAVKGEMKTIAHEHIAHSIIILFATPRQMGIRLFCNVLAKTGVALQRNTAWKTKIAEQNKSSKSAHVQQLQLDILRVLLSKLPFIIFMKDDSVTTRHLDSWPCVFNPSVPKMNEYDSLIFLCDLRFVVCGICLIHLLLILLQLSLT